MPRGPQAWAGAEALWVTARGWANAAEARFGAAWISTPTGVWRPSEFPQQREIAGLSRRHYRLPAHLRTFLKDVRLGLRQLRFKVPVAGPWEGSGVRLVWEHHDLFNQAGRNLSRAARAPLVRYVHAPVVWEARKWGVSRPLWGSVLELYEARALGTADLVACVSREVRNRLIRMGVPSERVLVSPMGVDADCFSPKVDSGAVRSRHGIGDDEVVIGWCGSFRSFHGLDILLDAFDRLVRLLKEEGNGDPRSPNTRLFLVGDGALRARLMAEARERGLGERVTFTGAVPHVDMPAHVCAMDLTVVSSPGSGGFHYSPLKAREYAACGRPIVAPREGEMAELETSGFFNLHQPGDSVSLARVLLSLVRDPQLRRYQGEQARSFAVKRWTWGAHLDNALKAYRRLPRAETDKTGVAL